MRALQLIAIVCACTLAFGGTVSIAADQVPAAAANDERAAAPVAAHGAQSGGDAVVREAPGGAVAQDDAPPGAQPRRRKKENVVVRVLAAPFRGLARLFRGGSDRQQAARVSAKETPRREKDAAEQPRPAAPKAERKSEQQIATVLPQPAPLPAPPAPAPTAAAPVSTVSPAPAAPSPTAGEEDGEPSYAPAPFTPLIVGVPGDPLSQGRALLEQGYLNEAIAELSVAAVTGPNLVEANNLLGLAYDRQGRHKQAHEAFERALSIAPADPHVLNNFGYSLYLDGYYVAALSRLRQAARLAPGNPHVLNNLALVYGRLQKYGEAFKHFERASGKLHARMQTGALLEAAGRDREAIKHYEAARLIDTTSAEPLRRLIPLYNRTGQRDKAEAVRRELERPTTKAASTIG